MARGIKRSTKSAEPTPPGMVFDGETLIEQGVMSRFCSWQLRDIDTVSPRERRIMWGDDYNAVEELKKKRKEMNGKQRGQ